MSEFLLPESYAAPLRSLEQRLAELMTLLFPRSVAEPGTNLPALNLPEPDFLEVHEPAQLQSAAATIAELQRYFAEQIQPLDEAAERGIATEDAAEGATEELPGEVRSRFRSVKTEMYRQLRLLPTDLMFLRSARQPQIKGQRQQQLRARLQSLRDYCNGLLALGRC